MAVSKTLKSLVKTFYLPELCARGIYVGGHSNHPQIIEKKYQYDLRVGVHQRLRAWFICADHHA